MDIKLKNLFKIGKYKPILLIIFVTSLVYTNSLKNPFFLDDKYLIVDNHFIKSWKNFGAIFTKSYLTPPSDIQYITKGIGNAGSGESSYRPIATISHMIDYSLWKLNPFGHHLTNLILHIFNGILLYFFIGLIVKNRRVAILTALLFAVHPVTTEAVNIVTFREDLLCFLFYISSFILFIEIDNYKSKRKIYCYSLSLIFFLLALFSKEMAITLPFILILYEYFFVFQTEPRRFLKTLKYRYSYIGYILVLLFYIWVWLSLGYKSDNLYFLDLTTYLGGSFYTNILIMIRVVAYYIKWLFLPINIYVTMGNNLPILYSLFNPMVLLSLSVVTICLITAIKLHKTSKEISFAILWFFITLIPVLPIFNYVACRYLYIPVVGFCFFVSVLLFKLYRLKIFSVQPDIFQKWIRYTAVTLLIFYSVFTMIRNLSFKNAITLSLETVQHQPNTAKAHFWVGCSFDAVGAVDMAITKYKQAIILNPTSAKVYNNLGICYHKKGLLDKAIKTYKKAIESNPASILPYFNISRTYREKKMYKESINSHAQLLVQEHTPLHVVIPLHAVVYEELGLTYLCMKDFKNAEKIWQKSLELNPENENLQYNLKILKEYLNKNLHKKT